MIYHYHFETGEYLYATAQRRDPILGQVLQPRGSTQIAPPLAGAHQIAVFQNGAWLIAPDHRGTVYYTADGSAHQITQIGETPPAGAQSDRPRSLYLRDALQHIDGAHAAFLIGATGGASSVERETWKPKEEAARAYIAGSASAAQTAMLTLEAAAAGITKTALAQRIIT